LLKAAAPAANTCIVIDQRLAGLSGLETLARLRQRGVWAPAILVTTHPSADLLRRAARAGVDVVEKPLLTDALARRVSAALVSAG
jgi:FixJ family two-component response regulator